MGREAVRSSPLGGPLLFVVPPLGGFLRCLLVQDRLKAELRTIHASALMPLNGGKLRGRIWTFETIYRRIHDTKTRLAWVALRNGNLAEVPVFVDGMVRTVCDVHRSHELAKNANDAILLTGYQDEESPGRALLELARSEGPKELRLGQETVSVACQFGAYGFSAHADRMQMVSLYPGNGPADRGAGPRQRTGQGDAGSQPSLRRRHFGPRRIDAAAQLSAPP